MSKRAAAENDWFVWLCVHPKSSTKIHLLEVAAENNCVHVSGQDKTIIFFSTKMKWAGACEITSYVHRNRLDLLPFQLRKRT